MKVIANKTAKRERANVYGGTSRQQKSRGGWCTSRSLANAVGPWDFDPFSNPRSHIVATHACMLECGDDGFGDGRPGSYRVNAIGGELFFAAENTRVWLQPEYSFVRRAFDHYAHTRWCALLRFDTRTAWFRRIYRASRLVVVLFKCEFEPPPGVKASSNPFPHALFYANPEDVTPTVLRLGIAWRSRS